MEMDPRIKKAMERAGYGVYNHSAVEICTWTKKAIKGEGFCYKQKFYGIDTHRCMEFSPAAVFCTNKCIYCWRPMEFMSLTELRDVDPPEVIYEKLLEKRRRLLSGFKVHPSVDPKTYEEALVPNHFAISLSGEPTLYPYLPELISFLRSLPQTKSVFLVTNGQVPEMLERLEGKSLPTQLYISFTGSNPENYREISHPLLPDYWERFNRSLEIVSKKKTRRVARITVIKGYNDGERNIEEFAELIEKYNPHFVEVKAYMYIGMSRRRLREENMPSHEEILDYARRLNEHLPEYQYMDQAEESRIVVLQNMRDYIDRWITSPEPNVP